MQQETNLLGRLAIYTCNWAERWFPDAFIFAVIAVSIVVAATIAIGAPPSASAIAFGDGFWSLIPFTMQMSFIIIGGYVVAASPAVSRMIEKLATIPKTGRGAIGLIALLSMLVSLIHWGLSLTFGSLVALALSRREELRMDYRAAGAAAYLGAGSVWALGLSSSAAQLQANPASMQPALLEITGVIPFSETIFLWQSLATAGILLIVSLIVVMRAAPTSMHAKTAQDLKIAVPHFTRTAASGTTRPIEKLEHSPLINLSLVALGGYWLVQQFSVKGWIAAIANLNTYNFLFIMLGLLLCWRPRPFLDAVNRAVPSVAGVLIQFPLYGGIAAIISTVAGADGQSISTHLAHLFGSVASKDTFPVLMGVYSAVLGFFVPSAGGKWVIEAPYVMQAANDLQVHLGWVVQCYNAAEALPNLINPFWMLPVLGILGLKARDIIGYTFVPFLVNVPLVLFLLWAFGMTLDYHPPVMP